MVFLHYVNALVQSNLCLFKSALYTYLHMHDSEPEPRLLKSPGTVEGCSSLRNNKVSTGIRGQACIRNLVLFVCFNSHSVSTSFFFFIFHLYFNMSLFCISTLSPSLSFFILFTDPLESRSLSANIVTQLERESASQMSSLSHPWILIVWLATPRWARLNK